MHLFLAVGYLYRPNYLQKIIQENGYLQHYLLYALQGEISRWHRLLSSEVWAWHMGGSLEMTLGVLMRSL